MTDPPNPFAAPAETEAQADTSVESGVMQLARRIFIEWEKLRVIYNLVLSVLTIVAAAVFNSANTIFQIEFWLGCLFGAFIANGFFFLGPCLESYCAWLWQSETKSLRWILFTIGTIFTAIAAIAFAIGS